MVEVVITAEGTVKLIQNFRNLAVIGKYLIISRTMKRPPGLGTINENDEMKNTSKIEEVKEESFGNLDKVIESLRGKPIDLANKAVEASHAPVEDE